MAFSITVDADSVEQSIHSFISVCHKAPDRRTQPEQASPYIFLVTGATSSAQSKL